MARRREPTVRPHLKWCTDHRASETLQHLLSPQTCLRSTLLLDGAMGTLTGARWVLSFLPSESEVVPLESPFSLSPSTVFTDLLHFFFRFCVSAPSCIYLLPVTVNFFRPVFNIQLFLCAPVLLVIAAAFTPTSYSFFSFASFSCICDRLFLCNVFRSVILFS